MNKPTEEQIKEFWEWCGQFKECGHCDGTGHIYTFGGAIYGDCKNCDGRGYLCPELDLNNLFKYAVPKVDVDIKIEQLKFCKQHFWVVIGNEYFGDRQIKVQNEDPALALFWAIYEVMK